MVLLVIQRNTLLLLGMLVPRNSNVSIVINVSILNKVHIQIKMSKNYI